VGWCGCGDAFGTGSPLCLRGARGFVGTLTGSSFGLVALLLGALFNAQLNRRRDDRLRDADRQMVAAALHAELSSIERTLSGNAQHLTDNPPEEAGGFLVPDVMHSSLVLKDMLPKIGLFDSSTIRKVIDAYILLGQYLEGLILVGGVMQENLPEGRQLVLMPTTMKSFTVEYNRSRAGVVKEAINALASYVK
jgi:hypothetical protein